MRRVSVVMVWLSEVRLWKINHIASTFNPCAAKVFAFIFRHLKLELLTQFPASNDIKYLCLWKIDLSNIVLLD